MRCVFILLTVGGIAATACGVYMALTSMLAYSGIVWAAASLLCICAYRIKKRITVNDRSSKEN